MLQQAIVKMMQSIMKGNLQAYKLYIGVAILMKIEQVLYFIGIHCMAHIMNLVVQRFSIMFVVSKLEEFL
jgi:hypothetical protein